MTEYLYKATTLGGQSVEGSMEGKDEETVVQSLHQLGYIPIRIISAAQKGGGVPPAFSFTEAGWDKRSLHIYPGTFHARLRWSAHRPQPHYLRNPDGE